MIHIYSCPNPRCREDENRHPEEGVWDLKLGGWEYVLEEEDTEERRKKGDVVMAGANSGG